MFIDKKVEYHSVSTHELYKLFNFTQATYSGSGLTVKDAIAPQSYTNIYLELTSSINHFFLRHWFYSVYNNSSFNTTRTSYVKQNNFVLQENSRFISIPLKNFGKRIAQNTIVITDTSTGSFTFTDDGVGNLIDGAISTTNFLTSGSLKCWFSFDDAYIYKQYPYKTSYVLRDNSVNLRTLTVVNGTFSSGLSGSGYQYNLNGKSYAYVNELNFFDFNKDDFSISFWVKIAPSQSVETDTTNTILSKKYSLERPYPFEIKVYNTKSADKGKLLIVRQGYKDTKVLQPITFKSSTALNDGNYHHIGLVKESGSLSLYVDGVFDVSSSDYDGYYTTANSSRLYIGATGDSKTTPITSSYFSGSIDELRVYKGAVDVTKLKSNAFNTNIVGSVFYEKGVIVFNNLSGSYTNLLKSNFTITYRSVSEVTEHEVSIKKAVGEFGSTMNPSLRQNAGIRYITNVSSSMDNGTFTPYITGIGLYNDENQLLAVAKIRQPIKNIRDLAIYFKIRFDI